MPTEEYTVRIEYANGEAQRVVVTRTGDHTIALDREEDFDPRASEINSILDNLDYLLNRIYELYRTR